MSSLERNDLTGLIQAISSAVASDSLQTPFTQALWDALAPYLTSVELAAGEVLFPAGTQDRNLFVVESGNLSVHYLDSKEKVHLTIIGPGALLGEGAFFAHRPRRVTVQAASGCRLWCLTSLRFTELSNRNPALALALVMAMGQVLAKRATDSRKRLAST